MNINRQNYEEYFILYLDNELDSTERRQVEAFVQRHPDLKEELDNLLQYKLEPDTSIRFDGKDELRKENGQSLITATNYPEWLTLYIDGELNPEETRKLEDFIAVNPATRQELDLFRQTKLQPETIVFADKNSLYRSEARVLRSPVRWWRLAAAAVLLLGAGITTAVLVGRKSPAPREIVKESPVQPGTDQQNESINPVPANSPVKDPVLANNNNTAVTTASPENKTARREPARENNTQRPERNPVLIPVTQPVKEEQAVATHTKTNDLPQPVFNPNVTKNDAVNTVAANTAAKENNSTTDALTNPVVTTQPAQTSPIIYASTNTADAGFEQADSKKNKSRGLFRKIARTFEKRTNIDATDDDRLLIAGLSIKLK